MNQDAYIEALQALVTAHPPDLGDEDSVLSLLYEAHSESNAMYDDEIKAAVLTVFDLRPAAIIDTLELKKPQYAVTASGGHFGRADFRWEQTDMVEALQAAIG